MFFVDKQQPHCCFVN